MSSGEAAGATPVGVTVLVAGAHLSTIDAVGAALQGAGLRDMEVMPRVGVVTGTLADAGGVAALERVEGVDAVEVARTIQLPPPDAPIQ